MNKIAVAYNLLRKIIKKLEIVILFHALRWHWKKFIFDLADLLYIAYHRNWRVYQHLHWRDVYGLESHILIGN